MNALTVVDTFWGDEEITPPPPILCPLTPVEASHIDRRIIDNHRLIIEDVATMRDRDGWRALQHKNFTAYLEDLCKRLETDRTTIYRKLQALDVSRNLEAAGIRAPAKLPGTHAQLLAQQPEERQAEVYALAVEISRTEEPKGMAAKYHKPGRVEKRHIEQALQQVDKTSDLSQVATTLDDPFKDEPEEPSRPDFFENRSKFVSPKPLHPQPPQEARSNEETPEPEMLSFVRLERHEGAEYVFIVGTTGGDDYCIPVRISQLREVLGK